MTVFSNDWGQLVRMTNELSKSLKSIGLCSSPDSDKCAYMCVGEQQVCPIEMVVDSVCFRKVDRM
eukprot:12431023-Karenia_brevis.AAC.1